MVSGPRRRIRPSGVGGLSTSLEVLSLEQNAFGGEWRSEMAFCSASLDDSGYWVPIQMAIYCIKHELAPPRAMAVSSSASFTSLFTSSACACLFVPSVYTSGYGTSLQLKNADFRGLNFLWQWAEAPADVAGVLLYVRSKVDCLVCNASYNAGHTFHCARRRSIA